MNALEAEINERRKLARDFGQKERKICSQISYRSRLAGQTIIADEGVDRLRTLYRLGLEEKDILLPISANEMGALAYMLLTGLRCVLPTCLDYSYEVVDGKKIYTFEAIGNGVSANAKTLIKRTPALLGALSHVGATMKRLEMLVSDVEADDEIYQLMSGLGKDQIRTKAVESMRRIENEIRATGLGMMTVGLMGNFIENKDEEFGQKQAEQVKDEAKTSIGLSRSSLYQTMIERSRERGHMQGNGSRYGQFHDFMIGRVEADLQRYVALGAACRRVGAVIVDATAPEVAKYYNVAADKYPVTPYIRIIDNYE